MYYWQLEDLFFAPTVGTVLLTSICYNMEKQ